jgi:hypothetical protein
MFRALISHPQEALHKRNLVYGVRIMSFGCGTVAEKLRLGSDKGNSPLCLVLSGSRDLNACGSKRNDSRRKFLTKCSEPAIIFGFPISFFNLAEICSLHNLEHYRSSRMNINNMLCFYSETESRSSKCPINSAYSSRLACCALFRQGH